MHFQRLQIIMKRDEFPQTDKLIVYPVMQIWVKQNKIPLKSTRNWPHQFKIVKNIKDYIQYTSETDQNQATMHK